MKVPVQQTLKKYGLSKEDWETLSKETNGICPICKKNFDNSKKPLLPVIDHLHIKNFKKMKPEQKKLYIRGIICSYCNFRLLRKGLNAEKAKNIAIYLEKFETRLNNNSIII